LLLVWACPAEFPEEVPAREGDAKIFLEILLPTLLPSVEEGGGDMGK